MQGTVEEKVMVTLLDCPELLAEVPNLEPKHFPTLGRLFSELIKQVQSGYGFQLALLPADLQDIAARLLDEIPPCDTTELRAYADLLINTWLTDTLKRLATDLTVNLNSGTDPLSAAMALERQLQHLFADIGVNLQSFNKLAQDFVNWLNLGLIDDIVGLTAIQDIDDAIGYFRAGTLVTVVAPTGGGKTSFGVHVGIQSALKGYPVCFISLEMTERQLMSRVAAHLTSVSSFALWTRDLASLSQQQLNDLQSLPTLNLPFYVTNDAFTLDEIAKSIIIARQRHNCRLIVLDYLQKVLTQTQMERRELEVASVAKELKRLALRHGVCIVALSQASSDKELRTRESRVIEHESDVILTLREKDDNPSLMLIHLRKNRMGVGNTLFVVDWDAATCKFGNIGGVTNVP